MTGVQKGDVDTEQDIAARCTRGLADDVERLSSVDEPDECSGAGQALAAHDQGGPTNDRGLV